MQRDAEPKPTKPTKAEAERKAAHDNPPAYEAQRARHGAYVAKTAPKRAASRQRQDERAAKAAWLQDMS
jgi:hypothetical protein